MKFITSEILKGHIDCPYQTYLRLNNERGEKNEFQKLIYKKEKEYRKFCIDHLCRKKYTQLNSSDEQDVKKISSSKKYGLYCNVYFRSDLFRINFDAIIFDKKDNLLIPIIFSEKESITINDKLLIAVYSVILNNDKHPIHPKGKFIYGHDCKSLSVRTEGLAAKAEKIIEEISLIRDGQFTPELFLTKKCDLCEFVKKNAKLMQKKAMLYVLSRE